MKRAGMPPTTVLLGTSLVTTALAATTEFSPMVTPGITVTAALSQTPFCRTIGAQYVERRVVGSRDD